MAHGCLPPNSLGSCNAPISQKDRYATGSFEELQQRFHAAMLNIGQETKKFGYNPVRFDQMVVNVGGLRAARHLLRDQTISAGLMRFWEEGRLDLSMEALVLRGPWCVLFTDEELNEARRRLRELDYVVEPTRMRGSPGYLPVSRNRDNLIS